jgi:hypothetical protein
LRSYFRIPREWPDVDILGADTALVPAANEGFGSIRFLDFHWRGGRADEEEDAGCGFVDFMLKGRTEKNSKKSANQIEVNGHF